MRNRLHRPLELTVQSVPEDHVHHVLTRLPGNQMLWLDVAEVAVEIPRLPAELDGLKVVHPPDLHLTGRIGKAYFLEIVRQGTSSRRRSGNHRRRDGSGRLPAVDPGGLHRPAGADAPHYFVLGNHDRYVGSDALRASSPRPAW